MSAHLLFKPVLVLLNALLPKTRMNFVRPFLMSISLRIIRFSRESSFFTGGCMYPLCLIGLRSTCEVYAVPLVVSLFLAHSAISAECPFWKLKLSVL